MTIFKVSEVKKMLDCVQAEQMTFSRMVELLNHKAYKELARKGQLVTMMDVVRTLEAFLQHNDEKCKSDTQVKVQSLISYIKSEVIEGAKSHLT
jgi:hypothetical protein